MESSREKGEIEKGIVEWCEARKGRNDMIDTEKKREMGAGKHHIP